MPGSGVVAGQISHLEYEPRHYRTDQDDPDRCGSEETKQALVWSKLLPLVMLVLGLTGAFIRHRFVRGEKERGTLETLLSSPASPSRNCLGQIADGDELQRRNGSVKSIQYADHFVLRNRSIREDGSQ